MLEDKNTGKSRQSDHQLMPLQSEKRKGVNKIYIIKRIKKPKEN